MSEPSRYTQLAMELGACFGHLSDQSQFKRLVESVRTRELDPDYIVLLRDRLTQVLNEAGIEPAR